jgi:hypothetical protein
MRWRCILLVLALVACERHRATDQQPPMPLDKTAVYPVIVPAGYLPTGAVRKPLIAGLEVALVENHDGGSAAGLARYLRAQDLEGMQIDDAYRLGLANLETAARRQEIPIQGRGSGSGVDLIVWGDDWRAATCVLLPGVAQMAHDRLGPGALLALIPHRNVLVILPDGPGRDAMVKNALDAEQGDPKPISDRVLRLVPSDQPFWIKPPVAWND